MAEQRLIDADALIEGMEKRCNFLLKEYGSYDHYAEGYSEAINYVENAPTVDAVEVVHGKWELRSVTSGMNGRYWCCSACGCIRSYWEYKAEDNYCFKCGAKMDGGNEDG